MYDILIFITKNMEINKTHSDFSEISAVGCLYILEGRWGKPLAIPVLKSETVTSNLPNRLVIVGCSLSCQEKVLVEEALFVPFELYCPSSHHEQCGLALGCLFCERKGILMLDQWAFTFLHLNLIWYAWHEMPCFILLWDTSENQL